jgi:hypothetical protein
LLESNKQWLKVTLGAEEDRADYVECVSLSFDGGSLICFADEGMRQVRAAYSPTGWARCMWVDYDEVCAEQDSARYK